jgi:hypothetical protein
MAQGMMLRTVGITNNAGHGNVLFFGERDCIDLYDVYEEVNFLSKVAEIDIDVLESSTFCYHLVSYDILTREELLRIERLESETGHYPDFDELGLSRTITSYKRLRIGEKLNKDSPRFLKRFKCRNNPHIVSLTHQGIYMIFCNVPRVRSRLGCFPIDSKKVICMYLFGSARKNLRIRRFQQRMNLLERKIDRKV